ncbi:tyrosine-type recombinase/integrase [Actinorugispora endophytica]|uniref:Site-specific recombinase XerC n=1 Tax=Actinorugispora endophytica TaxID=1605990 RepID=A0A4R6UVY3_9ACTN|nr:tyrosine-type recombinase/integrase [Actinorugispora endophytica]TDQ51510.1 site-specific recombinase XerC [Actinorugispora endophytica]
MSKKRRFGRVRKLPSGRYQARYPGPDGKDRPAPHTFARKTDADRWLSLKEAEIVKGEWIAPDAAKVTVGDWGARWIDSVASGLKPKTVALYRGLMRSLVLPRFGTMMVADVRPITVAEWMTSMKKRGLSASRIRHAYLLLSQIMRSAVENDMIAVSPCRGVKLPRLPQTDPRILTVKEADRLVSVARRPHDLIIQLLAYGGLRIGEAFALRRFNIDLVKGWMTVTQSLTEISGRHAFDTPKSHQKRTVGLPAFVVARLREHLDGMTDNAPDALLFLSSRKKPFHYNSWRRAYFDPAVRSAELTGVTPHDLRASHASWVADRHGVLAAARRLGHSNASVTTRHYARALDGRDADVAASFDDQRAQPNDGEGKRAHNGHGTDESGSDDEP